MHKSDLRWFYIQGYPPGVSGFSDRGFLHLGRFCMYRGELPRRLTGEKLEIIWDDPCYHMYL